MIQLVRNSIRPLLKHVADGHAGLLMQRGLVVWQGKETDGEKDKSDKLDLIDTITSIQPSEIYKLAFDRWLLQTYNHVSAQFCGIAAEVDGRLFSGLALGGTLETAVTTQHSYGMPMLAGSSVKGAVRSYAECLFSLKDANGNVLLEKDSKGVERSVIDPDKKPLLDVLFGTDENALKNNAGYLIWHDAWWIPGLTKSGEFSTSDDAKPFVSEIVTAHHQNYYGDKTGKLEAEDIESPNPTQQLGVKGGFYFVIEGHSTWLPFVKQLLERMLQDMGAGAKTASGYGYFKEGEQLNTLLKKHYSTLAVQNVQSNDPDEKLRITVAALSESDLITNLSKDKSKFFKLNGLDVTNTEDCQKIADIVYAEHADAINSWESDKAKNTLRAYKFIINNRSI